ncbi:MAG: proline--tRNA ligase [Thermoleophilia bacterium]
MRASQLFMPTLKEDPSDAEAVSHKLLVRGGFVRQFASGMYIFLPLGWRVMERVNRIIREEMNAIGGLELSMPTLHTADVWQQTGRYYDIGGEMFRLKDRGGRDMVLAMTHEEVFAWLASRELRSYRDLPQIWYQIQLKFRDEPRPKGGILRVREFQMKDSYSFDVDAAGLEASYAKHIQAYDRIFERTGLVFYRVESDPGMMGGAQAHEYMAPSPAGEDRVVLCDACGYAANVELARSVPSAAEGSVGEEPEEVATPDRRTIKEVSAFLEVPESSLIKSLLMVTGEERVLVLMRGDHELHEGKLGRFLGREVRAAHPEEVLESTGVGVGFVGPVGLALRVVADESLDPAGLGGERTYVAGANRPDTHLRGVRPGRDFTAEFADVRAASHGDGCVECGAALRAESVIEVGNIFKLGTKYSAPLGATVLTEDGAETPIVMGSYGIGPARIAASAVEQSHDERGIVWPKAIAPFDVHLVQVQYADEVQSVVAESIYRTLGERGWQVLWDDRDERPGVKFKDAELIGCPVRVTVGRRAGEGVVEVEPRAVSHGRREVPVEEMQTVVEALWDAAR